MERIISVLFQKHFDWKPERIIPLPQSGSARQYYRIEVAHTTYIGCYHPDKAENCLFIDFSAHFRRKGLPVPQVYCVSEDKLVYIQEDLGDTRLLDVVEHERTDDKLSPHSMEMYKKALSTLLRFQFIGGSEFDYSRCVPRPLFDRRCILWDLNYFKYCFLRLAGATFSEQALENDFESLANLLCQVPADGFMFRDFQSRNIMVRKEKVWFIDYQGGRRGALQYDVASLLYDAVVRIPEEQREELLDWYICELQRYKKTEVSVFRTVFYRFALIRLLQAMGAFGLRGLYERKQHFLDSIHPGLETIYQLFESNHLGGDYLEIRRVVNQLRTSESF